MLLWVFDVDRSAHPVALVTGGCRRIGAEICRLLHKSGFDVIIHFRSSLSEAQDLAHDLNSVRRDSAKLLPLDLRLEDAAELACRFVQDWRSRLDLLVNNASVFYPTACDDLHKHPQAWSEILDVNLKAPYLLSLRLADWLRQNSGCIVNITDIHGDRPLKNYPIYSISKAGLIMMTKSLARELAPHIRCNAVSPGSIVWSDNMDEALKK